MEFLGLPFYLEKKNKRYKRLRNYKIHHIYMKHIDKYYSSDINFHTNKYLSVVNNAKNKIFSKKNNKKIIKLLMNKILNLACIT